VSGYRSPQHGVMLVDELGERGLGDRDEGNVVGDLEDWKVTLGGGLQQRGRNAVVQEADAEAQPGQLVVGQSRHELPLALLRVQLQPGREQQLTARQPRRRVEQLRDVDPPDRQVQRRLACEQTNFELVQQFTNREHPLGAAPR
jgi:hypothetical protein